MSEDALTQFPQGKETMEDNARKFIVDTVTLDFLRQHTVVSYDLVVDWLVTDEASETKVVSKKFDNGEVEYFLIEKVMRGGVRSTEKKRVTKEEYKHLRAKSVSHLKKRRSEFEFVQNGVTFMVKYDKFPGSTLSMLEVDAENEEKRKDFDAKDFPFRLREVTGDIRYYGYRVTEFISIPPATE